MDSRAVPTMTLWEVDNGNLIRRPPARFADLGMRERDHLQALLRDTPDALGEDLLVIGEEYGQWEDARRRIDLLAIDRDGCLVVIELKRTDDGGHMELQALRYAAMVASMGFDEVLAALVDHRARNPQPDGADPRRELIDFLLADGGEVGDDGEVVEPTISTDVRIVLVSADFGREITTAVLWLNGFEGMDIRCLRLMPYEVDDKVLIDVHQIIPLPEAASYQVQLRRKEVARERATRADNRDFTRFHVTVDGVEQPDQNKRNSIRVLVAALVEHGVAPSRVRDALSTRSMRVFDGRLDDQISVKAALSEADTNVQVGRWFVDHPFFDAQTDKTYVLIKMWGSQTEETLQHLVDTFPEAGVTFRAADA